MSDHPQHRGSRLVAACRLAGGLLVVAFGALAAVGWLDPASPGGGAVAVLAFALLVAGDVLAGEHRQAVGLGAAAVGLLCFAGGVTQGVPLLRHGGLVLTVVAGAYVVALGVGYGGHAAPSTRE